MFCLIQFISSKPCRGIIVVTNINPYQIYPRRGAIIVVIIILKEHNPRRGFIISRATNSSYSSSTRIGILFFVFLLQELNIYDVLFSSNHCTDPHRASQPMAMIYKILKAISICFYHSISDVSS